MRSTRKPATPLADRLVDLLESIPAIGPQLRGLPPEARSKFNALYTELSTQDEDRELCR